MCGYVICLALGCDERNELKLATKFGTEKPNNTTSLFWYVIDAAKSEN